MVGVPQASKFCCILSSGLFPGVWTLYAYEDGTDRVFRNVGI